MGGLEGPPEPPGQARGAPAELRRPSIREGPSIRERLALGIATVGGVGRAPLAPGSVASGLTAAALWLAAPSLLTRLVFLVVVVAAGTWAADRAERALGAKDPGAIVADEVAGMTLAVLTLPIDAVSLTVGFVLFRVFDVLKPFPAGTAQHLPGGLGVMLDDLIAGLYALALGWLAAWLGWL
jgi:phosphatidylglycerophosphatase A